MTDLEIIYAPDDLSEWGVASAVYREEVIRAHKDVLFATDFFTQEVWKPFGLVTYYVLFVIHVGTRRVHLAGVTDSPHGGFMEQAARELTFADDGFLNGARFLIHDRDSKCTDCRERLGGLLDRTARRDARLSRSGRSSPATW